MPASRPASLRERPGRRLMRAGLLLLGAFWLPVAPAAGASPPGSDHVSVRRSAAGLARMVPGSRERPAGPIETRGADADGSRDGMLALVLSGGGARGTAHIGVLKVLEDLHVAPDLIVGTSMGAIVGGLYAAGYEPEEIEAVVGEIDWDAIFFDKPARRDLTYRRKQDDTPYYIPLKLRFQDKKPYLPAGVLGGQNLEFWLRRLVLRATAEDDFDDLPVPYRAVAMDLATSDAVVLGSGNLADAMRASIAVPGILPPVEMNGRSLVDGGSAANLPVGIAQQLGAERIIAINISTPLEEDVKKKSFFEVLNHLTAFLTAGSVQEDIQRLREGDVLIEPDLGDITFMSFDRVEDAVEVGEEAARAMADRLRPFAATPAGWERFRARHERVNIANRPVQEVVIEHAGWVDDRVVERRIDVPPGEPLDQEALASRLERLRGLQYFGMMRYDLENIGGASRLKIEIGPRETGRANLQFGGSFRTDFEGDSTYALLVRHQWLAVNRRAAEWVNILQIGDRSLLRSEFLQPLDWGLRWFVTPRLDLQRSNLAVWIDGARVTDYEIDDAELSTEVGRFLGNWGKLSTTFFRGEEEGEVEVGLPSFPDFEESAGGIRLRFAVDTREQPLFPTRGGELRMQVERNLESLGAPRTWTVADIRWQQFLTAGRNTFAPRLEARSNIDGEASVGTTAFIGGFRRLSGLGDDELFGDRGGVVGVDYYYEFLGVDLGPLSSRVFAGVSLEAGNTYTRDEPVTWDSLRAGGALYAGAATPVGPVVFGWGWTEPGRTRVYLRLGARY